MAKTDINVRLSATGSTEAAANINKAKQALDSVQRTGSGMSETFGKKFSAIGLTNLNYALLHSIEYTGKAKPVIGALNMGFYALMGSVGATTSALFPYIAGIAAVVAIVVKMKGAHDSAADALKKQLDGQIKSGEESKTEVLLFDELHKVLNTKLTPAMQAYEAAIRGVNAAKNAEQIATLTALMETEKKTISDLTEKNKELNEEIERQAQSRLEQNKGMEESGVQVKKIADDTKSFTKYISQNSSEVVKLNLSLTEQKGLLEALRKGYSSVADYVKATTAAGKELGKTNKDTAEAEKKAQEESLRLFHKALEEKKSGIKESEAFIKETLNSRFNLEKASTQGVGMMYAVLGDTIDKAMGDAYLGVAKASGDAFAKMVVEGKSFGKTMEGLFKNVLESFISMVAQMIARWAMMKIITGWFGVPLPGFMMHAAGTDRVVDRPTMFMAGDNGPERISVTPIGSGRLAESGGGSGGGGDVYHVSNFFTISGAGDPQKIADMVSQKIIYSIRGRGQLNFVRGT